MSPTSQPVRTRFAPSPTGFMHIGNLRTALYEYLVAKSQGGQFLLRIEDTDRERLVEGAVERIYDTLRAVGMAHDEGPDIGGPCGPYVQSERKHLYRPVADTLIEAGHAYPCFCSAERLARLHESAAEGQDFVGYDRHCRDLDPATARARMAAVEPYVIRQKMPLEGQTTFTDLVYGAITVDNRTLEDQILIKSDGYPTYNFANVVDDHQMGITHVVRGSEYLSSTPKYQLLYDALGYTSPAYIHLPLILGSDGQKLSKRHGATSFEDLTQQGYLPEAIVNYLALLGWSPSESTREMFTLAELEAEFTITGISKSPAVFSEDKLNWFNGEYIRRMDDDAFIAYVRPVLDRVAPGLGATELQVVTEILRPRLTRLSDLEDQIRFLGGLEDFGLDLFVHKKSKSTLDTARSVLTDLLPVYTDLGTWARAELHAVMTDYAAAQGLKNATVMWPVRIGISGRAVTPGGAAEVMTLLGRDETLSRMRRAKERLDAEA